MRGPRWLVLVGCFFVSVLGASAAKAGGAGKIEAGTIAFAGAIVEPTCNISAVPNLLSAVTRAAETQQSYQRTCSDTVPTPVNASRIYRTSVVHLSNSEPDQVLRYFASYVRTAQPSSADPVMVTQTYE
jgi:type 1 fimbria pilin